MKSRGTLVEVHKHSNKNLYRLYIDTEYIDIEELRYLKGKNIEVSISEDDSKTNKQNATFWHCIDQIRSPGQTKWEKYLEAIKNYSDAFDMLCVDNAAVETLKSIYRETEVVGECYVFDDDKVPKRMSEVLCYRGISKMTKRELSKLIDGVINEMIGDGLEPPSPQYTERFINQNEKHYSK